MKTPVQTFVVSEAEAGQKLLQYLVRRLGGAVPQAALQRFIRTGQVRLDGRRARPFDRIEQGQKVRVPPYEPGEAPSAPTAAPLAAVPRDARRQPRTLRSAAPAKAQTHAAPVLDILHEDADLLVVVKPAGLPVHPGSGHATALTTILHARSRDAPFRPTPAHRLDRDTTGVLLVAKSYRMLRRIHDEMLAGEARKDYLAWVWGRWLLGEVNEWVTLRDRLSKQGGPGRERVEAGEDGKEAVCKARLLGHMPTASLLEVRLETGRTQQIRAQLAARGHPIVGDPKYGGGAPPLLLHAWRVTLTDAAFCAPPAWEAPWTVKRLRRASFADCLGQDAGPP
ncbi:RluA family pseudouridine synthase [Solidesulfovibrio sp.]|uniref:RluA family pseudouridine synthase n=1 Tax=Solidesulfovibrio sp. TaxID=2910990 RepID=UPI00261ECB4D|nr:RluA family pseudouridine synthase [Solidesulfovibrio sp.]